MAKEWNGEELRYDKWISVATLAELLTQLPPNYSVGARTVADTGNMPILDENLESVGHIDVGEETIIRYDFRDDD